MAASFTQWTDTDCPDSTFDDLYVEDLVLAACCVGHRQLSQLEVSPYQQAVLASSAGEQCWRVVWTTGIGIKFWIRGWSNHWGMLQLWGAL